MKNHWGKICKLILEDPRRKDPRWGPPVDPTRSPLEICFYLSWKTLVRFSWTHLSLGASKRSCGSIIISFLKDTEYNFIWELCFKSNASDIDLLHHVPNGLEHNRIENDFFSNYCFLRELSQEVSSMKAPDGPFITFPWKRSRVFREMS